MKKLFEENLVKDRFDSKYEIVYLDTLHLVRRLYPHRRILINKKHYVNI